MKTRKSKKVCDGTALSTILAQTQVSTLDDKQFGELAKSGDYLVRIQLFAANSLLVKQGKFPMAHWGYVADKDNPIDLGGQFDCVVLALRGCAARLTSDPVITVYDVNDPEYAKIRDESDIQDSGCVYGPEFLIYIPAIEQFATYHMNNATARRESPKMKALIGKFATIKAKFIEGKKHSWHGPDVTPCSAPLNIPASDVILETIKKFVNPEKKVVESAPDAGSRER